MFLCAGIVHAGLAANRDTPPGEDVRQGREDGGAEAAKWETLVSVASRL